MQREVTGEQQIKHCHAMTCELDNAENIIPLNFIQNLHAG